MRKFDDKSYTGFVEFSEDLGEYILKFDNSMLEQLGWKEGDNLEWVDNKDGSYTLSKVTPKS